MKAKWNLAFLKKHSAKQCLKPETLILLFIKGGPSPQEVIASENVDMVEPEVVSDKYAPHTEHLHEELVEASTGGQDATRSD